MVARQAHDLKVVGSTPAFAKILKKRVYQEMVEIFSLHYKNGKRLWIIGGTS